MFSSSENMRPGVSYRAAFAEPLLCGVDHYSGQSYEHRRQWVVDRIRLLSSLFAIDICAYAVMRNTITWRSKFAPNS